MGGLVSRMYAPSENNMGLERVLLKFLIGLVCRCHVEIEIGDYCAEEMGQIESEDIAEVEGSNVFKRKQLPLKRRTQSSSMQIDGSLFNLRKRSLLEKSWRKTPKTGLQNI
uniref:Uncharacterized protein n=1 Tax=Ascaris lumbricoides TaxID=6252 RepID=A0A0M3IVG1_ASCLU